MTRTPSTLKSEPVDGIVKMTAIERIAYQNNLQLLALGWNSQLGLTATVADVDTALRLVHYLSATLHRMVSRESVTCLFDGTELRIHIRG